VTKVIHGHATNVHSYFVGFYGGEGLFLISEAIVDF